MSWRSVIFLVLGLLAISRASPVPEAFGSYADHRSYGETTQQFLVLHPQVVAPQLGPLKYEQPIIAPITQLGHISTPKEQLYFFYPSSPLSQAPQISFQRDDGQDFNLINFISNWFASKPAEPTVVAAAPPAEIAQPAPVATDPLPAFGEPQQPAAEAEAPLEFQPDNTLSVGEELRPVILTDRFPELSPAPASKPEKIEINPDAEFIPQTPQQPQPKPQNPQQPRPPQPQPRPPPQPAYAPFPLIPQYPDRRVYIVSGQPQFFGNFDAFANPLNPIFSLQPLSAIVPRSKDDKEIEAAEETPAGAIVAAEEQAKPSEEAAVAPVADLKLTPEVVAEEIPGENKVITPVDIYARFNSRIELDEAGQIPTQNQKALSDAEKRISDAIQDKSGGGAVGGGDGDRHYNEPSVAQAAPSGLAIAGIGGVASSQPSATAVTGDGGISLASPKATAIAGDFFDFDEKKKIKTSIGN